MHCHCNVLVCCETVFGEPATTLDYFRHHRVLNLLPLIHFIGFIIRWCQELRQTAIWVWELKFILIYSKLVILAIIYLYFWLKSVVSDAKSACFYHAVTSDNTYHADYSAQRRCRVQQLTGHVHKNIIQVIAIPQQAPLVLMQLRNVKVEYWVHSEQWVIVQLLS